jgi:hypothetical protein
MERIEEIFVPESITTMDGLMALLVAEIQRRGGDPTKLKMLNTETAIPNVQFSEEWPCWTFEYDIVDPAAYRQASKGE